MNASVIPGMLRQQSTLEHAELSISNLGEWVVTPKHEECTTFVRSTRYQCGAVACWNRALGVPTTLPCQPYRTLLFPAMFPPAAVIGQKTSLTQKWKLPRAELFEFRIHPESATP